MELDTLKKSWNTISADINQPEFDIISALKKEMNSPLAELRKKAEKQIKILPILFAFLVVIAVKTPGARDSLLIWMALIILPFTLIYYYFNVKLIRELEVYHGSVKNDIETKVKKLINSNDRYLIITRLVFLTLLITSELMIRYNRSDLVDGLHSLSQLAVPLRLLIYTGIFGLHYLVSAYTFNLYFGRHLKRLKSILSELQ